MPARIVEEILTKKQTCLLSSHTLEIISICGENSTKKHAQP